LDKKELQYWIGRYPEVELPGEKEIEENLTKKFQKQGFATQEDLRELLKWKFGMMPGRMKRELNLIEQTTNKKIIEQTKKAFQASTDKEKIKHLKSIKGFGNAVCSVALTLHDPQNFGVFDIHAWRELFGKEPKNYFETQALIKFLEDIRRIAKENSMSCRDVEKAVFTKNYLGSKATNPTRIIKKG